MSRRAASYMPILGAYLTVATGLALATWRLRGSSVARPRGGDVVLLGLATFKLSRLVTKERVTQPLREPFVVSTEPGEDSEVNSEPAGTGARRSVGELVTCPFCISIWIATLFTAAFALAPRAVRLVASALTAVVIADSAQYGLSGLRKAAS